MEYPLYVHWIPAYQILSERALDIIFHVLEKYDNGVPFDDLEDSVENVYTSRSVKIKDIDLLVTVFESGLFVVKGKPQNSGNINKFSEIAQYIYRKVRDERGVHVHLFDHKLSKFFPIAWCYPEGKKWSELRQGLVDKLTQNYFNDLADEKSHVGDKKEDLITGILVATYNITRPMGFWRYLYPLLQKLIERRLKATILLGDIFNCIGVQTFISSFRILTKGKAEPFRGTHTEIGTEQNFIKGYNTTVQKSKEFTDILGSYTLQVVVLILTVFGISIGICIPFVVLLLGNTFFSSTESFSLDVVWIVGIMLMVSIIFYVLGYWGVKKMARSTEQVTLDYFRLEPSEYIPRKPTKSFIKALVITFKHYQALRKQ